MHKETTTKDVRGSPQCGAMSTNSSSSLLSSFNLLTSTKPLNPTLHRTGDLRAPLHILFPELGTTQSDSYNHLHLALQVLNAQYA
jgi:hypothetical protein